MQHIGRCAVLHATESSSSRRQMLCTAPRLQVVHIKRQCRPPCLPSRGSHPALRGRQHRCFAASPMQSPQDAEDFGRGKSWDVKMLYDGAPLHVTATKASDVEQRDESVIIRPTPLVQLGRLGTKIPGPLCFQPMHAPTRLYTWHTRPARKSLSCPPLLSTSIISRLQSIAVQASARCA